MRIVYYDFYTDDFVLFLPSSARVVEIGVRKPRLVRKGPNTKYTPYIMAVFPEGRLDGPFAVRFKAVPMHLSDRVNSEITIESGAPKVGYQRSYCGDTRPAMLCNPYSGASMMSLVGKLALPNYSNLDDVDERARDLLKNNATHLLYREVPLNEAATVSRAANSSTGIVSDINDNNIARSF